VSGSHEPTAWEFEIGVHALTHLLAEKGRYPWPAELMLMDCWAYPFAEPPEWACQAAQRNEPGWTWCPKLSESLAPEVWAAARRWMSEGPRPKLRQS
jgi:hypothetical protein